MKAYLILEDGTVFPGTSIGSPREIISEIVFNTSMTGYLEILTDPSYAGQAVVMTYSLIGNYGICTDDMESRKAWPDGFIVREISRMPGNFRSGMSLQEFLDREAVTGICGVDTRALTKLLREKGTMNGMITTRPDYELPEVCGRLREYRPTGVVRRVSCTSPYDVPQTRPDPEEDTYRKLSRPQTGAGLRVALLDFGAKRNIARSLAARGCQVTVYPAWTRAEEILASRPDGIMLSNGPGDPKECTEIIREVRSLYDSGVPIFAICLGHQLMALATGADTYRLKYGHRGGNHPVKETETGRVYISSQNHGYAVDPASLDPAVAAEAFVNVNDGTNEGLRYLHRPVYTVQFHPEACPGPQDSGVLFDRFIKEMREGRKDA